MATGNFSDPGGRLGREFDEENRKDIERQLMEVREKLNAPGSEAAMT